VFLRTSAGENARNRVGSLVESWIRTTRRVIATEVPATGNAELTHYLIAQRPYGIGPFIHSAQVENDGQDVDDGLGMDARNRSTADVMDVKCARRGTLHADAGRPRPLPFV
jgi:hypothetical protein